DSLFGEESGDEHIGVGKVELSRPGGDRSREGKEASLTGVEERAEDARRVEGRAAKPINGPVGPDEGHAVQIPHQAMVGDRQAVTPTGRPWTGRWRSDFHDARTGGGDQRSAAVTAVAELVVERRMGGK